MIVMNFDVLLLWALTYPFQFLFLTKFHFLIFYFWLLPFVSFSRRLCHSFIIFVLEKLSLYIFFYTLANFDFMATFPCGETTPNLCKKNYFEKLFFYHQDEGSNCFPRWILLKDFKRFFFLFMAQKGFKG